MRKRRTFWRNKRTLLLFLLLACFFITVIISITINLNKRNITENKAQSNQLSTNRLNFPKNQERDYVLFHQITDEHIDPANPVALERLRNILLIIKKWRPDLLLSTGDHTTNNDQESYQNYINAFRDSGSFIKFPTSALPPNTIPFMPVAGNHDAWTFNPYDNYRDILSYTVGELRFIGFSHDFRYNFPAELLENELIKSCQDSKPIIVYHHYSPHSWYPGPYDIDEQSWKKLNLLMIKYPVILYLGGHVHQDRTEATDSYIVM